MAIGGVAFGARGRVESSNSENLGRVIVALEEESIGSQDLAPPSPAAVQTPGATGAAGAEENPNPQGWATTKASVSTPGASSTPGAAGSIGAPSAPTAASTEGTNVPAGTPSPGAGDTAGAESQPAAEATDVPPAMDIGSLMPTRAVSDSSLKLMIEKAPNPALAASLRITEKARVEIGEGHVDDAIRDLAYAVSIDPSNSYAYFYLGRAYAAKKDYAQAITFFKRAETGVRKSPAWLGETYAFEGLSYEESGKQLEAAAAYQKALAATPGNLTARVGFTRLSAYVPSAPGGSPETDVAQPPPTGSEIPPPPSLPPPPAAPPPLPSPGND
ncbi:MAG: tetratricopeptide repeat protein [Candidatus Binatus sp.]|uniref:tetratricopeptide repeat protein n=1 Tax=Candidatus Binatus sp. TaxID=2811406 RepID=UPI002727E9DF|nr:tetratricopeptide repeat protein [Candidatus Binatus sp.]MDO8433996.1 tetratricopeptide repeat protein [Candidatus Binatus sp.]